MNKYKKEILLVVAFVVGALLHDGTTIVGCLGTIGLIAGFINVYFTTKRSTKFIIPDIIWIIVTIASLLIVGSYAEITLYAFYTIIAFVQFKEWRGNRNAIGDTVIKRVNNFMYLFVALLITLLLIPIFSHSGGNNIILGCISSGFGIVGSVYLAKRYYQSEYLFVISNIASIVVFFKSGLYQLSLIPMVFLVFSVIFLWENRKEKNVHKRKQYKKR